MQITFVQPCGDDSGDERPRTEFTLQNRVREFMFETPFTKSGSARGALMEQFTRKTYLTVQHEFPFIKSRQEVILTRVEVRTPLEGAIETIKARATSLDAVAKTKPVNLKLLQLQLQVCGTSPDAVHTLASGHGQRVGERRTDSDCRSLPEASIAGQPMEPRSTRRTPQGSHFHPTLALA